MTKTILRRGASRRSILQQFGAAAVGISLAPALEACSRGGSSGGRVVNFYNWDTYIGETTLADFQHATSVPVHMTLFASNDELFARLRAGNPGYDVVVPSNEYVTRMAQAQMVQALDHSKIPNMRNIIQQPEFTNPDFDPGRRFSVPYTWLDIGIGYRKSRMPRNFVPDSWRYLLDSAQFTQKIAVLGESADLIRIAAKYKGHSVNGIPEPLLAEIEQMLIRQKPHIKRFHSDDGQDMLVSGEVDLVMEYNGDIAQVMRENDDIGWVMPREGSLKNSDCLCIPSGAPHVDDAHAFINYILDGEAGAKIAQAIQYATPNQAARDLMPDAYKNNQVVYPPPAEMARLEYGTFEGDEVYRRYEEIFTRISAA